MLRVIAITCLVGCAQLFFSQSGALGDALDQIHKRGKLIWGADREGGAPYVYPDPREPARVTGFEVSLASLLARELGAIDEFFAGPWQYLPDLLNSRQIDVVINGYELTAARAASMAATRPYYIYELHLLSRRDDERIRDWRDLRVHKIGGQPIVGTLNSSAAYFYLQRNFGGQIDLKGYEGNLDAISEVEVGKLDASVADTPVVKNCLGRFPNLHIVGEPQGRGYYVMYVRRDESRLRDAIDAALIKVIESGELRRIYEQYDLWSPLQEQLRDWTPEKLAAATAGGTTLRGWEVIRSRGWLLVEGAWMTVQLACLSMPLAIALGLAIAIARVYGPAPARWLAIGWVEFLRGTPLLLQLYLIFYVLPDTGIRLSAYVSAILGLAINYSAYEAEIYRAGLNAIPRGQMEAALSLGMTPWMALRRIVVPQAVRLVVPPVTNDFIALFKDTSVCSIITVSATPSRCGR